MDSLGVNLQSTWCGPADSSLRSSLGNTPGCIGNPNIEQRLPGTRGDKSCSKLRGKHGDFTGTCFGFARSLRSEFRVVDLQFHPTYQPGVDSAGDVGRNGVAIL